MKYTIDDTEKTITLEQGTWEIEKFLEKITELKDRFEGYKISIVEKIQLIQTHPFNVPANPVNPWTPEIPYHHLPGIIYCSSTGDAKC